MTIIYSCYAMILSFYHSIPLKSTTNNRMDIERRCTQFGIYLNLGQRSTKQ